MRSSRNLIAAVASKFDLQHHQYHKLSWRNFHFRNLEERKKELADIFKT